MFGEGVDHLADRHRRIVAVEHVEVDRRKPQPIERLGEILGQGLRVDAGSRFIGVATLGQDEDVVGKTAALEPEADGAFGGAAAIDVAGVDGGDAVLEGGVEERVGVVLGAGGVAVEDHRAEDEAGEMTRTDGAVGHRPVGAGRDADARLEGVLDAHATAYFVHQFEQPD